ncbi:hypothetical protein D9M68_661040 [compost metagenome]
MDQYFLFEVLREGACPAHLHAAETAAPFGFQIDREQLQASHPAVGQFVQDFGILSADFAELLAQVAL